MSAIGKGTLSLRKKDVSNSRSAGVGFVKVVFAHKATGGESSISLAALTAPPEMLANGFVQPSASLLSDLNIYNYRQNLTLRSSIRGELWDYLSYTVASNSIINFLSFTLLPNEVIEGVIDNAPRDGLMVVDGSAIVSTGTLAAGTTDFNVNGPFEYNKYPTQQAGAVLVYRDGIIQARCDGNSLANAGNYVEVAVSGTLTTLIRFKNAASSGGASIMVLSNGVMFERPAASTLASIEKLGGQMDKVVQVLSDAAGVPTTTFQTAPNSVDLATFGNQVIQNTTDVASLFAQFAGDYSYVGFKVFSTENFTATTTIGTQHSTFSSTFGPAIGATGGLDPSGFWPVTKAGVYHINAFCNASGLTGNCLLSISTDNGTSWSDFISSSQNNNDRMSGSTTAKLTPGMQVRIGVYGSTNTANVTYLTWSAVKVPGSNASS